MSFLKTTLLLALLTALFIGCGWLVGGPRGATFAFLLAVVMNFGAFWFSDRLVLRMSRARPVGPEEAPRMHRIVSRLCERAEMPVPTLHVIDDASPNAFATGRSPSHAAVAATTGLLRLMDDEELEGVLGHELSHVQNRDVLVSTIAATFAGAVMMLASWARWAGLFGGLGGRRGGGGGLHLLGLLVVAIVAPLAALVVRMAVSRTREFAADASGARLTGHPAGLARALSKLEQASQRVPMRVSPATSHLFIVQPLTGGGLAKLFASHPPIEERVRRLLESETSSDRPGSRGSFPRPPRT